MKNILKRIGLIALAFFVGVGSLFMSTSINKNSNSAFAVDDTSYNYSFQSSGNYAVANFYSDDLSVTSQDLVFFNFKFTYNSVNNNIYFYPILQASLGGLDNPLELSLPQTYIKNLYTNTTYQNYVPIGYNFDYALYITNGSYNANNNLNFYHFRAYASSGFNCNIYKVDIYIGEFSAISQTLNFKYYDVNDNYIMISLMVPHGYVYGSRTYYFANPTSLTDNQYYNQGYNTGKSEGISIGENQGYNSGYTIGYDDGFETGKLEGVIESNDYSFFGLISAIIDAPVTILTSLFNFNFLGVNLWAFFTSILTISLVIFVIRKFMAKG